MSGITGGTAIIVRRNPLPVSQSSKSEVRNRARDGASLELCVEVRGMIKGLFSGGILIFSMVEYHIPQRVARTAADDT
jgi:hypothetical protein